LQQQIADTRGRIVGVLAAIDDIRLQQNPWIEVEYALKIGCYQNELLKAEIAARRAKRKLTLAQMAVNSGEAPDELAIDIRLDEELNDWYKLLSAQMDKYLRSIEKRNTSSPLTAEESRELKLLYHKIVKRLHPDLNPQAKEPEMRLFLAAQTAYERGDLVELRAIAFTVEGLGEAAKPLREEENPFDALEIELAMQQATLSIMEERLAQLKSEYPYQLLETLNNPAYVEETVRAVKEQIAQQKEIERSYTERIKALMSKA
jgi:hypothetical protein